VHPTRFEDVLRLEPVFGRLRSKYRLGSLRVRRLARVALGADLRWWTIVVEPPVRKRGAGSRIVISVDEHGEVTMIPAEPRRS
jgi:hypothetical protein